MFISNIISKLLAIIYKLRIIYKSTTTPTNKDQQPRSNYYKYMFHRTPHTTCSHTQHTATSMCLPLSFAHTSSITSYTCFTLLTHILTWASESFVLHVPPPIKGTSPSRHVKFRTPLNHVNPNISRFWILVRTHFLAVNRHSLIHLFYFTPKNHLFHHIYNK